MEWAAMIHRLRVIASFALAGAVVAGVTTGWVEQQPIDYRAIGAALGAVIAIIASYRHAL